MTDLSPKKRIISAGEEIMAETGLNAKISHIASRAGVSASVLYHYFKNKEDLLFSIAEERLRDLRETMEEQLLGLNDPLSRLRKLFFFRLHYLEKNRNCGRGFSTRQKLFSLKKGMKAPLSRRSPRLPEWVMEQFMIILKTKKMCFSTH